MQNIKEIKKRISAVSDTEKITRAMYLIASVKQRKAREELFSTRPFFDAVSSEIKRIFRVDSAVESRYFYPPDGEHDLPGAYGYLVITSDRGLAGAYNANVIKAAAEKLREHDKNEIFAVGEYGRDYFFSHGIPIREDFRYTAERTSLRRAREIADFILDEFDAGHLSKIFVIYTDFHNGVHSEVKCVRLLPFHRKDFADTEAKKASAEEYEFYPSLTKVLENIVPTYAAGFIYSAMTDSFCSEQNARMTAMKAACDDAGELLSKLRTEYNHVRQNEITSEITEISAGAAERER